MAFTPRQPTPGVIFEDISENGLLDLILDDGSLATYVRIDQYDELDGPGSMLGEVNYSAANGDQTQEMVVQSDPDPLGILGAFGICNRYFYYSQSDGTESGFTFGAYTYEDLSFGSYGGALLTSRVHKPRGSATTRCVNGRSEGPKPIHLYLNPDILSTTVPLFMKKDLPLHHSRSKSAPCCWFSRPGNLTTVANAPPDVFLMLQKNAPTSWMLVLRGKTAGNLPTYISDPAVKYKTTEFSKASGGLTMTQQAPLVAGYPASVIVTS